MRLFPITPNFIAGHNRPGRKLQDVRAIIIHWTANASPGATALANRNYFNTRHLDAKGNLIYASAHYVVDSTSIVQCLPDNEMGYHVGAKADRYTAVARQLMGSTGSPNNVTIGIEMCVNVDGDFAVTYDQTVQLTRYLAARHGIARNLVLRHYDLTGKDCPRMLLEPQPWKAFLDAVFGPALPVAGLLFPRAFLVNVSQLNVRQGPGTDYTIVEKLPLGREISCLEKQGSWYRIGESRYVHADYIKEKTV